ncbi:MAG TPA: molybdopterin-dependent oxidoreductase [Acidobacteriota bacterium]|nr:molybdopterin-dependent oxidoreductase [Acidobacteriota bacterium]
MKVLPRTPDTEIIRTTVWSAGPGCHGTCGVLAHIRNGKLAKIEGDPDHPWNQGRLCARCLAMTQYAYHPDRLTRPLMRAGRRGEGKWKETSWEEAFAFIEEKMGAIRREYGPESVVFSMGTGRDISPWLCLLAYAYGSPNVMFALSGNACYSPRIAAVETVLGDYCVVDAAQWLEKRYDDPRYRIPECLVIWGYNIPNTCPDNIFGHWFIDLMKRGTKVICMDPRLTWFSSRARHWLRLRPGTDGALAMAFLNVIIREKLYDHEFVEKWTNAPFLIRKDTGRLLRESDLDGGGPDAAENFVVRDLKGNGTAIWQSVRAGFRDGDPEPALRGPYRIRLGTGIDVECVTVWDAFCEEVDKYPPARVSEITGVAEKEIMAAARFYARSKPAMIHWGLPIDSTPGITPTAQAITALWCITGNLEEPGGNIVARNAFECVSYALPGAEGVIRLSSKEADQKRIGLDKYGPFRKFIWRAQTDTVLEQIFSGKPYPIKGLWMQTGNIIAGIGFEPKKWREAFKSLDFIAAVDLFMTPTTQYADIVLPAATFLEKDSVRSWWVPLQTINKAMTVEDCRPDVEINFELARRFDPGLRWKSVEELFDAILQNSGMSYRELKEKVWAIPPEGNSSTPYRRHEKGLLRKDGRPGFATSSGKVELYSILREEWGLEPLPHYEEPPFTPVSRPDLAEKYPLILSTGRRSFAFFNAEHRNIPWLRELDPYPTVEIHPDTARNLGIDDGEWVWVENWLSRQQFKAKLTPAVLPEMVMAAHGWWFPEEDGAEPSLFGAWKSNINNLIPMGSQGKDGLGAPIKSLLCRVYKLSGRDGDQDSRHE